MAVTINASTSSGVITTADNSGVLQLQNAGTTAVTIDAGLVGIGTTTPTGALLHVSSSSDTTYRQTKTGQSDWGTQTLDSGAWRLYSYTATAERMRIDSAGNVGIGTTSPRSKFNVSGNTSYSGVANSVAFFQAAEGTTNDAGVSIGSINGNTPYISATKVNNGSGSATPLLFYTDATERMRIDTSGNLLVGTAITASGSATPHIQAGAGINTRPGATGTYGGNVFNINWTGSAQLWIDTSNIGTIAFTSDYRIKRNIETQTAPALERVMALRPVTYQMADYGTLFKANDDIKEGFIAHEVQEVIPSGAEGVKDAENQIQSLRVDAILAVAVKAIQEQQTIINELKSRIEALEGAK